MLRRLFVALSQSRLLARLATAFGPARRVAHRFVAGETLDEAIAAARGLNRSGALVALDHLGENVESEEDARRAAAGYREVVERIAAEGVEASISIKLTHVGLDHGVELCLERMREIVASAREHGITVEVDIEGSDYTEATLEVFHGLLDEFGDGLRLALQSYLHRTRDDLAGLIERGSSVRLVKGAYDEPAEIAWRRNEDVDASFARLTEAMFDGRARETGFYPALGTHDHNLIEHALRLRREQDLPPDRFEFQMLYGIRRDWQQRLVDQGYRVRVYVPYGAAWYPYFMRRLAERPQNVGFFLRALFGK